MPENRPEDIVPHLLREIRERMATRDDIARVETSVADLRSDTNSLAANAATDVHELRKDLSDQIVGLRRAVVEYHSAVIGHGNIIAELEARVRRMEQHLGLDSH
jgi:signal transduction histidine kinase